VDKIAWGYLGSQSISQLGSGATNGLSGGRYSLRDSNVQDGAKDLYGEERDHHDVGRDLGDEVKGLYDKTQDSKIGL